MSANKKILWLKRILVVKVALAVFYWGLPNLLMPVSLLGLSGVPIPADPIYLRLLGAVICAFGVAYWYAYKDPVRNVAIVKAGVVDNGLTSLVALYFILFRHLTSILMLVSVLLTLSFFILFLLLMPKPEPA